VSGPPLFGKIGGFGEREESSRIPYSISLNDNRPIVERRLRKKDADQ
jgi:hypothetical protein